MYESQNIKNSDSQVSMACRLVKASHVFALTGTPVENSIQDFFSIMNVVLPGLFSAEKNMMKYASEDVQLLAKAFSPFILRRKKQEVLKDLPSKSEQILYCELSSEEKQKYEELKNYYWGQLKGVIDQQGLNRSKIQVLEALLRLRQASCHIGLLDQTKRDFVSAKFELLLEQIQEIISEGHKVLVFSQFTQLLELFKTQLNRLNLSYHYLDGQTKDRKEIVTDFQMHDDKKIFLLSLKAGGVGLNLTAAEYVFILDPWWNPAVEAQAIDRAHRIGQTKKVFAYKMIAKDTVEEKILKLQETKKDLLENLLSQKKSVLKNMTFEEISEIFS
ncbi:MAG: DEAD/DEAH box helicase [Pseudobdellovibrionaceae bacterium]